MVDVIMQHILLLRGNEACILYLSFNLAWQNSLLVMLIVTVLVNHNYPFRLVKQQQ